MKKPDPETVKAIALILTIASGVGFTLFYVKPKLEQMLEESEWNQEWERSTQLEREQREAQKVLSQRQKAWDLVHGMTYIRNSETGDCYGVHIPGTLETDTHVQIIPIHCSKVPQGKLITKRPEEIKLQP